MNSSTVIITTCVHAATVTGRRNPGGEGEWKENSDTLTMIVWNGFGRMGENCLRKKRKRSDLTGEFENSNVTCSAQLQPIAMSTWRWWYVAAPGEYEDAILWIFEHTLEQHCKISLLSVV